VVSFGRRIQIPDSPSNQTLTSPTNELSENAGAIGRYPFAQAGAG
jgi:hypothetical protein